TLCLGAIIIAAKADPGQNAYTVNDQRIESVFQHSINASITNLVQNTGLSLMSGVAANSSNGALVSDAGGKSFVAALLLDLFLGGLGIHRLYLGTKTMTWVGYILTCGGIFGIVPLVDLVVLIVHNEDISPYVNNPKFFMWAGDNM
ncbi:MAG: TM2 domain-containing protein, partial [Chitinophagaceae bacterium]